MFATWLVNLKIDNGKDYSLQRKKRFPNTSADEAVIERKSEHIPLINIVCS